MPEYAGSLTALSNDADAVAAGDDGKVLYYDSLQLHLNGK